MNKKYNFKINQSINEKDKDLVQKLVSNGGGGGGGYDMM